MKNNNILCVVVIFVVKSHRYFQNVSLYDAYVGTFVLLVMLGKLINDAYDVVCNDA